MIAIRDLGVRLGAVGILAGISLDLDESVCGVIGPNGAGKTTLLNALAGAVPSTGTISLDGRPITGLSAVRRARSGIRRTFQTDQVVDDLTVEANVTIGIDGAPRSARRAGRQAIERALAVVGLGERRETIAATLPTVDRRLLEIGRALAGEPRVLLMDEPGAGLPADGKERLCEVIRRVPDEVGAQVILVEHDVQLVSATCTQLVVLDFGQVIGCGPTAEVLADPQVRRAYLGADGDDLITTAVPA